MKDLLEKLKKLVEKVKEIIALFKEEEKPEEQEETEEPTPTPEPEEEEPAPSPTPGPVDATGDPEVTDPTGGVTSFLWKPVSDTNSKVTVITVSADTIRSEDLRVQCFDKDGTKIPLSEEKNPHSKGRGNQLPGHKFARINFKPGWSATEFKKVAPITVRFQAVLSNGKRASLLVMGKDKIVIKDPTQRLDLK